MLFALLLMIVLLAAGVAVVVRAWQLGQIPPDLRGNWWGQFESEFRAYAARASTHRSDP